MDSAGPTWLDDELAGCEFADQRLGKRLRKLLAQIGGAMGGSIPLACEDWANTKAAYRFFSNERVNEGEILAGHFQSTRNRAAGAGERVFVIHDTTEFSFQREDPKPVGITRTVNRGQYKERGPSSHTVCGILMHSSLVLTVDGLPLGLAAVKFWTRKKFKGSAALKRKVNPTRVPIDQKITVQSPRRQNCAGWTSDREMRWCPGEEKRAALSLPFLRNRRPCQSHANCLTPEPSCALHAHVSCRVMWLRHSQE